MRSASSGLISTLLKENGEKVIFKEDLSNITSFPLARICSGRAEGWVCDNPPALQFVGSKQEVSLAIIALFSMESGRFGPKKKNSRKSGKPAPTHVWAESGPQEAQWSSVHGAYLSRVSLCRECSGEETQRSQRGQTAREEEEKKGFLTSASALVKI